MSSYLASTMDSLDSLKRIVDQWDDSVGQVWSYQVGHPTLEIRLDSKTHRKGNIHLMCFEPWRLEGTLSGRFLGFEFESIMCPTRKGGPQVPGFLLEFQGVFDMKVWCSGIQIERNVSPVF